MADVAENEVEETKPKRRPGRPKKNPVVEVEAKTTDEKPKRGRRKSNAGANGADDKGGNAKVDNAASNDGRSNDVTAEARAAQDTRDSSAQNSEIQDSDTQTNERGRNSRKRNDADDRSNDKRRAKSSSSAADANTDADTTDNDADNDAGNDADNDSGDEDGANEGRGRNKRSQRRNNTRRQSLNYRDLQSKILPELHLLALEVGVEDYRKLPKDELAVLILERSAESEGLKLVKGYLEISSDGYGFLQESLLQNNTRQVIVSAGLIKQFKLRTGDYILGKSRRPRDNERYGTLIRVEAVNGTDPFQAAKRPRFDDLIPTFPETRIKLETTQGEVSSRVIDLLAPIGRGQRGLIVAPPKAGKTTLLKKIANAVITNEPDIEVIVLLVDERPEEVTDFRESVQGVEVIASTFDEPPANHIRVAEFVHERARRIVEEGGHVMILLDSITRLARANNLVTPPTGRTLSGGPRLLGVALAQALFGRGPQHPRRRFFEHPGDGVGRNGLAHGRRDFRRVQGHRQHGVAPVAPPGRKTHFPRHRHLEVGHAPRGITAGRRIARQDVAAAQSHQRHGPGRGDGNAAVAPGPHQEQRGIFINPRSGLVLA